MTPIALARPVPAPANDYTDDRAEDRTGEFEDPQQASPLRVLLAEDNETMRRLVGFVLRADGHAIVEARDGAELLEKLATSLTAGPEGALDAIVSEHSLPGLEGLTILAGLRARGLATPFVLITADLDVQARARRLGGVVLDQPFNTQAIRDAVTEAAGASTRTSRSL